MKNSNTRPLRGPQALPTLARRRQLLRMLTIQAGQGDTNAAGWLLFLAEQREAKAAQS